MCCIYNQRQLFTFFINNHYIIFSQLDSPHFFTLTGCHTCSIDRIFSSFFNLVERSYLKFSCCALDPLPGEDVAAGGEKVADHRVGGALRDVAHKHRDRRSVGDFLCEEWQVKIFISAKRPLALLEALFVSHSPLIFCTLQHDFKIMATRVPTRTPEPKTENG